MVKRNLLIDPIVAYYRVSSEEQRLGQNVEGQAGYVRDWCRRHEVVLSGEFVDEADNGEGEIHLRDGGQPLYRAAQSGAARTVLVFAVDRTGRSAYACLHAFHILRQVGTRIISVTEDYDPDEPTGKLLIALLAGKSESDKRTIYLRTESGKRVWEQEPDFYVGGVVPFGYMLERRGKRKYYIVCRLQIPGGDCTPEDVILYIYRRCLEDATCHTIAQELNAQGITTCWVPGDQRYDTPTRGRWYAERVAKLIRNPFYKGVQMIGAPGKSNTVRRSEPFPHPVPAIVSEEDWSKAQAVLKNNRTIADRNAGQFYLLRGKIICRMCGRHYTGTPRVSAYLPRGRYYRCNKSLRYTYCPSRWLVAEEIDEQVKAHILWILGHTDEFVAEIKETIGGQAQRIEELLADSEAKDRQRLALEKTEMEYYRMRTEGLIPTDAKLRALLADLEQRSSTLSEQAASMRQQARTVSDSDTRLRDAQSVLLEYQARANEGFSDKEWQRLVGLLVDRVEIETVGKRQYRRAIAHVYYRVGPAVNLTSPRPFICLAYPLQGWIAA